MGKKSKKNSGVGLFIVASLVMVGFKIMLSKKAAGTGTSAGAAASGAGAAAPSMTRAQALKILAAAGHKSAVLSDPRQFQDGYLIAWAKSVQNGQGIFTYKSKQYIAQTGTSK